MSEVDEFDEVESSEDELASDNDDVGGSDHSNAEETLKSPTSSRTTSRKRKMSEPSESDQEEEGEEEEEDEIEEEEEEEEDDERGNVRKKSAVSDFFLDEVEVDSDEEEEEEVDEGLEDEAKEAEEAAALARMYDRRRARDSIWKNMNDEEINQYFKNKYSRLPHLAQGESETFDIIAQKGLLPTTKDPNLWMVKCRIGEEKLAVLHLIRKAIAYQNQGEIMQITSAICKEGLKGRIYIEAFKQSHVVQAIEGVSSLNPNKIQMVPIAEMPAVLNVVKDTQALKPGVFVRMRRTMFKDDLAQVDWIDLAQKTVHLKLIPRIDYTRQRGSMRQKADQILNPQKRYRRPAAKLFDAEAIKMIGGDVSRDGDLYVFEGNRYSRKGFLYKGFPLNAITADGIKPSLAELEKFQDGVDDLKAELGSTSVKDEGNSFSVGDKVEVCSGELLNLRGKVVSVDGKQLTVLPDHVDLNELLKFYSHDLRKFFKPGDHVRVTSGRFEGDTGLIVKVEPNRIVLMSDLNMQELQVLPKDVQLYQGIATGVDSSGQCRYEDLVQLDQQTVGVIIQIEREFLNVLNMHGKVVRVKQQALYGKKDTKFAIALDSDGNNISNGVVVNVIDGPHCGMKGEIRHVYRSYIFVHSKTYPRNGGLFVCRSRHLIIAGAKIGKLDDNLPANVATPPGHSPITNVKNKQAARAGHLSPHYVGVGNGYVIRDNSIIGKYVKIIRGPMKGYRGTVKDATPQMARVELPTHVQPINVDRSHLRLVDSSGETDTSTMPTFKAPRPVEGSRTPMQGSATPMYGSMTPMHDGGSRTPYYGSNNQLQEGSRTPAAIGSAWDPSIANTPARPGAEDDFGFDESGLSNKYGGPVSVSPATPGGYSAETPMGSVYTVDDMFNVDQGQYHYGNQPSASPSFSVGSTGSNVHLGASPGSLMNMYSKGGSRGPMSISSMSSASPMIGSDSDWICPGLEVLIRNHERFSGKVGTVKSTSNDQITVYMPLTKATCVVYSDQLEPSKPQQADKIKVVNGEDKGVVGKLLSIDGEDGVVKTDTSDIRLYNMSQLCKLVG